MVGKKIVRKEGFGALRLTSPPPSFDAVGLFGSGSAIRLVDGFDDCLCGSRLLSRSGRRDSLQIPLVVAKNGAEGGI